MRGVSPYYSWLKAEKMPFILIFTAGIKTLSTLRDVHLLLKALGAQVTCSLVGFTLKDFIC